MHKNTIYKAYYFIIPLLIVGISLGYTSFLLTLAALIPLLVCTDRYSVGFFLLMYGGPLGGVIRAMYPSIPVYGVLLMLIGAILMWDMLLSFFRRNLTAMWWMLVVLLVFGVFYLIGPMDEFAQRKYSTMVIHGIVMVLGYYAYSRSPKINTDGLTQILIVSAICMFAFSVSKYNFQAGNLTDYNWFRSQSMLHSSNWATGESMLVNYQQIGMLVLLGVAIFFSQVKLSVYKAVFYFVCGFQLVMVSGSRQAILGILVISVLRIVLFREYNIKNKHMIGRFLWSGIGALILFAFLLPVVETFSSNIVNNTLSEGDSGRQILLIEAWNIFQNNPLTGAGLGGFNAITQDAWPHNFIMELLCETGLMGTFLFIVIVAYAIYKKKAGLLYVTTSGHFYFLFMMALFVRVLVSSDFTESIELFSAVFAISNVGIVVKRASKGVYSKI